MTGLERFLKEKSIMYGHGIYLKDLLLEFERQAEKASEEMEKNFNTRFRLTHRRYREYGEILGWRDVCLAWVKAIKKELGK